LAIEAPNPTTGLAPKGWTAPAQGSIIQVAPGSIPAGSRLGERYEIQTLLGEGGMGAVYKARDCELDRMVALKVIRPQLASNPDVLARFKQELILARQVTHKNVIRIFDLGMAEGTKFITMEYVEGKDLKTLLNERTKFAPQEAADIMLQVCAGLNAAHQVDVIHRDLKPHNIMLDPQGRVLVMDFGLALSAEASAGMTRTGALMGTPDYMSPEQAKAEKVDARSDLFCVGIIFYEMVTGKLPFEAESLLKTLLKRTQERARPPIELEPELPKALNDIIMKCLATDPADRYQSAAELLADLEAFKGITPAGGPKGPALSLVGASTTWRWISASLAVLLAVIAGVAVWEMKQKPPAKQKTLTLLVADFNNTTEDPVFDGTLEPMFTIAMEGASFVNAYNRFQARQLAGQVRAGATKLDESVARLIAVREAINVVVAGTIARQGEGYEVSAKAIDAVTGKVIASQTKRAGGKEAVLASVGKLAAPLRRALGDSALVSAKVEEAETFTSASLEAAHRYSMGQDLLAMGKYRDAIDAYSHAIQLDPNFGRAYSGLGVAYRNLGQRDEAEKHMKMALVHINQMTDREKYRTRGAYYVTMGSYEKAAEEYGALVKQYPADAVGHNNLALAYFHLRNLPRAIEEGRRAVENYPKNVAQRSNVALYTLYSGAFDGAEREARAVMDLNSSFERPYFVMAAAELAQGRNAQAAEWYQKLQKVSAWGASYAAMGLADLALYEGRTGDAIAILDKSLAAEPEGKNNTVTARKLLVLADAYLAAGQAPRAVAVADRAVALDKAEDRLFAAASIYLQAGQVAKARTTAAGFQNKLEAGTQAYAKIIEGEISLKHKSAREAIKQFEEAQKLMDTWMGRFALGRAYLEAEAFTEADSELDLALKRKGEVTAIFLDDTPTYRYFPPVHYYLGRAREGLKSPGAAQSYRGFLAIKERGAPDQMVTDAKRRLNAPK
jgi:tetratricopeptide (TPR) repeat protein